MFRSSLTYFKTKNINNTIMKLFSTKQYEYVNVSTPSENVGLIQLNRPKAKNALSLGLIKDLNSALKEFEENHDIGSIVLYGEKDYFAAGADIKEMKDKTYSEVLKSNFLTDWNYITSIRYKKLFI
jgi:enoyl-CoA hydratase